MGGRRFGHAIIYLRRHDRKSLSAVLVLSAETRDDEGNFTLRSNVIHELGAVFQGASVQPKGYATEEGIAGNIQAEAAKYGAV